jgi:hypothetical protein
MNTNFIAPGFRRAIPTLCLMWFSAASLMAQGRVDEFLGVQNWHGIVTIYVPETEQSFLGLAEPDFSSASLASTLSFQLPTVVSLSQSWTGTFHGSSTVHSLDEARLGTCTLKNSLDYSGPIGAGKGFTLHLQGPNQYMFFPSDYVVAGATGTSNSCSPVITTSTGNTAWAPAFGAVLHDLPATGFSLTGAQVMDWSPPVQPFNGGLTGQSFVLSVLVSWHIEPGLLPPQVVVTKTLTRDLATSDILVNVSVTNTGGTVAENTQITTAKIGFTNSTSIPLALGDIDPGDTATGVLHFPPSTGIAGTPAALVISGTYKDGSFSGASKVTLP